MVPTVEDAPRAATVGPVTAAPLQELEPLVPERFRMRAMLKQLTDVLS